MIIKSNLIVGQQQHFRENICKTLRKPFEYLNLVYIALIKFLFLFNKLINSFISSDFLHNPYKMLSMATGKALSQVLKISHERDMRL